MLALYNDDHDAFRASVREFVHRHVVPNLPAYRVAHRIDRALWLEAGSKDFLGLAVPERFGGSGLDDFRFNAVLSEELARASLAVASSFGIHTDVVAPYLVELGKPSQQERWLSGFCTGESVTAIAMTEPQAGSDLAALRTRATRTTDGWLVSGSKTFITNGGSADLMVVAARTGDDRRDITLFGVEATVPGLRRGEPLEKVGQAEADTAEVFLDEVAIPEEALIGGAGEGFRHMLDRLPQERLHSAVVNLAHARAAFERTLEYVKERRAFGRAVGTFQHNRFRLAEMATELDVGQAFVDRCVARRVVGELDAIDAAKAKWWTAEIQNQVLDTCVQLHGGYGYMTEYAVARGWLDARVTKIWAGSNEVMKEMIGRSIGLGEVDA